MKQIAIIISLSLLLVGIGYAVIAHEGEHSPAEIALSEVMAVDTAFSDYSVLNGAPAAFDKYLHPMTINMPDGASFAIGHDSVMAAWTDWSAENTLTWKPEGGAASDDGTMAFTYGYWKILDGEGVQLANGKYVTVWKKHNGEWRALFDGGNNGGGAEAD